MSTEIQKRPQVGIPWRTRAEEDQRNRAKLDNYFEAVRRAGGDPKEISLASQLELEKELPQLDGFVLPGSPADVDPALYGKRRRAATKTLDPDRDRTDRLILDHALATHKPVLAICYGCQILNVHQGGTLVQDIPSEKPGGEAHGKTDLAASATRGDLEHDATLTAGGLLQKLAGAERARINSSHHQAIDRPGENLRVTARAGDGIIEGVELDSPHDWVVGVQWHPERMPDDTFARKLFADFVDEARKAKLASAAGRAQPEGCARKVS